jgi:hypothetical protein
MVPGSRISNVIVTGLGEGRSKTPSTLSLLNLGLDAKTLKNPNENFCRAQITGSPGNYIVPFFGACHRYLILDLGQNMCIVLVLQYDLPKLALSGKLFIVS